MAQTIDIIIKISQKGDQAIKDVVKRLGELNAIVSRTDTAPIERLNQGIQSINKSISSIESNVKGVIGSIVNQTDNALTGSVDKFKDETGRAIETLYARSTLAIGSIFFFGQEKIALFIEQALSAPTLLASLKFIGASFKTGLADGAGVAFDYVAARGAQLKTMLTGFSEVAMDMPAWLTAIQASVVKIGLPQIAEQIGFIGFMAQNVFGYIAKTATLGGVFLFARVWLNETGMLVRRLTGHGEAAMRPLERATRLLTTLDSTVASIGFTSGQAVKTVSLGLLTIWGPFSGIIAGIPFINSLVTSLLGIGLHFRTSVLASFGSARAQFTLIFLDFKKLALIALPILIDVAKSFKTIKSEATFAGDNIRKVGDNVDKLRTLQGLSRLKLPIGAQLQALSVETKTMMSELLLQLNKISLILQKTAGLAKTDIAAIDVEAKKATNDVALSVEKSATVFDKIGKKTGIFDGIKREWRNFSSMFAQKGGLTEAIRETAGRASSGKFMKDIATAPITAGLYAADKAAGALQGTINGIAAIFGRLPKTIMDSTAEAYAAATKLNRLVKMPEEYKKQVAAVPFMVDGKRVNLNVAAEMQKKKTATQDTTASRFSKLEVLTKQEAEAVTTASQFGAVKNSINAVNDALKSYSNTLVNVSRSTSGLATVSTTAFGQIAAVAAKIPEQVTGLASKISEVVRAALPAAELSKKVTATSERFGKPYSASPIPKSLTGTISSGIIPQAQQISAGKQIPGEAVIANLQKFAAEIGKLQQKLGTMAMPGLESLAKNLQNISNIKTEKIKDALPKFEETISKLIATASTLDVKGKNIGDKFISLLTRSIKENHPAAEQAVAALAELIASYFPQSPAKKGALRGLTKSGGLIPSYIASGMESAKASTNKAANDVAEGIAKHFPRSLPVLGPLIHLVSMGVKIPFYIAQGITSGLKYVIDAARKLAEPIAKIFETSEQTGVSVEAISALQSAFARLGGSVDDAKFAFNQINALLGRTLNDEELDKVRKLGINMSGVRKANEPTLELLLQVSEAIKGLPPQSEKFRAALELLGITAQSSLAIVLRQGPERIKELMKQGVELGLVVTEETAKAAKEFVGINAQLDLVKSTILNDLMAAVLPRLVDAGNKILEIIGKIRPQITAVLTIAGNGLLALGNLVIGFVNLAIRDPKKAMTILLDSLEATLNLMKALLSQTWEIIKGDAKDFLLSTGSYLTTLAWSMVTNLFSEMQKEVKYQFRRMTSSVFEEISAMDVLFPTLGIAGKILGKKSEWQGSMELGGSIGRAITKSMEDAEKATTKYLESASKAAKGVASDENVNKLKETWKKFAEEMKGALAGTELEGLANKLTEALTIKNFNETIKQIEQIKKAARKSIEEIGDEKNTNLSEEEVAAAQAAEERLNRERESNLQLLQMRSRANPLDENLKNDVELMELEARQKAELEAYDKLEADKTKVSQFAALQRKELENEAEQQRAEAEQQRAEAWVKTLDNFRAASSQFSSVFAELYEESGKKIKEFFYISKAAALAEAVVNIAKGVTQALGGGIFGIAQGAMVAAAGAIQVAKITASTLNFAEGGKVTGGSGTKDDVPAMLTAGEQVIKRPAVAKYGDVFMDAINNMLIPKSAIDGIMALSHNVPGISQPAAKTFFGDGGKVLPVPVAAPAQPTQQQSIQIVNIPDPNMVGQYLSSSAGRNALLNIISNDPRLFRAALTRG